MRSEDSQPKLSRWHLVALGTNAIVGSGIYLSPGLLASYLGPWSFLIFPICGCLLWPVAISMARLSVRTQRNGGIYAYASLAFGGRAAFLFGWVNWICAVVSCGAVSGAFGFYLSHFVALSPLQVKAFAAAVIVALAVVNCLGVSYGGFVTVVMTALKILPLAALAVAGLGHLDWHALGHRQAPTGHWSEALILALFTCQGFEVVPIIAGETRFASRSVPRAIVESLGIAVLLYSVMQLSLSAGPAVGSPKPLADQAVYLWGRLGGDIIAAAGMISVVGFVAGIALAAHWLLTPLCEARALPPGWAKVSGRGTPIAAILLTMTANVIFVFARGTLELLSIAALSVALGYLISGLAIIRVGAGRDRVWGLGAVAVALFFLAQVPWAAWGVLAVTTAIGVGLSGAYRFFAGRQTCAVQAIGV